jgi:hypothetical protein
METMPKELPVKDLFDYFAKSLNSTDEEIDSWRKKLVRGIKVSTSVRRDFMVGPAQGLIEGLKVDFKDLDGDVWLAYILPENVYPKGE